jgi:hypothetical protein
MKKGNFGLLVTGEMLAEAGIDAAKGVTVEIENGTVLISETDALDEVPAELLELFEALGVGEDAVRAVLRENNGILAALTARRE